MAAVSVVAYHYSLFLHDDFGVERPRWLEIAGLRWLYPFQLGSYGVSLFFVISGFVIFMTLRRTAHATDFAVSRFSRLYPAYWCGMLITSAFRVWLGGESLGTSTLLANATMVPGWLGYPSIDGVYWTLVVELQFYAIMLFIYLIKMLSCIEWVCLGWLGLLAVVQVSTRIGPLRAASELVASVLILRHIPLFSAGMMFYRIFEDRLTRLRAAVIGLGYAATWLSGNISKTIVVTLALLVMGLLVAGHLRLGAGRIWRWLGDCSYGIYLVHMTVGLIVMQKLATVSHSRLVLVVAPTLLTLGLAWAINRLVEKPALRSIRGWYDAHKSRRSLAKELT